MSVTRLPDPADPELAPFWEGSRARQLRIPRCTACEAWVWYPQVRCRECHGRELAWTTVSGRGSLFTWVTVHRAFLPELEDLVPFVAALVELVEDSSLRMATILERSPDQVLRAGAPVEVFYERMRDDLVLPRFRLV